MKELNDIIQAFERAVRNNKRTALVTVVRVDGSSYRRPGARMLVTEDGEITGAISGGCLEGDALRKAQLAMRRQQNRLEIYDTTNEEDSRLGLQLGCNGVVYILFEPILQDAADHPVHLLKKAVAQRKEAVVATGFSPDKRLPQSGTCLFVGEEEAPCLQSEQMKSDAREVLRQKTTAVVAYGEQSVLYQFFPPVVQLVVVGAGNDAQPLSDMAALLGWNIVVVDGRPAYATPQRFPNAGRVCLSRPEGILSAVKTDAQTAFVIMTHNYKYDLGALAQLVSADCGYVGVLGPKKKLQRLFEDLARQGITLRPDLLHKIHGPVGLDIGAETAEEIALSILAEIKAVFSGRRGTPLRERRAEIHERSFLVQYDSYD